MAKPGVLDTFRLDGRRVLITGGATGLGRVMATALAEAGADVALASRKLDDCRAAAAELERECGRRALGLQADVTRAEDVTRLARELDSAWGGIDILINNAGINLRGATTDLPEADFDAVVAVNLKGPFLCSRAFAPGMLQRGWGRIINMGSIMSVVALPGRAPYASSKGGVLNLTRALALEWASSGITVNALCPGLFATELNRPILNDPEKYQAFVAKIPMGRWGELHEIKGAVLFLASNAASYMTGSALFLDGGWTAQ